jgi:hypothetical protein
MRTRKSRRFLIILIVLLSLFVTRAALAQTEEPPTPPIVEEEIPPIEQFLSFIASPVGAVIIGAFVSQQLERWAWYEKQSDEAKRWVAYGLTAGIAIISYVLVEYVPEPIWVAVAPYWVIVAFTAFAIFGNQGWFQLAIRRTRTDDGS